MHGLPIFMHTSSMIRSAAIRISSLILPTLPRILSSMSSTFPTAPLFDRAHQAQPLQAIMSTVIPSPVYTAAIFILLILPHGRSHSLPARKQATTLFMTWLMITSGSECLQWQLITAATFGLSKLIAATVLLLPLPK